MDRDLKFTFAFYSNTIWLENRNGTSSFRANPGVAELEDKLSFIRKEKR
ncbi:hypothetical protein ACVWYN_002744 [Pedobacter sp. UYP24]